MTLTYTHTSITCKQLPLQVTGLFFVNIVVTGFDLTGLHLKTLYKRQKYKQCDKPIREDPQYNTTRKGNQNKKVQNIKDKVFFKKKCS